jgi:predicted enzyme related to lactoylglutathione lyase
VLNFQPVPEAKTGKSRVHLDLECDDLQSTVDWIRHHGGSFAGGVHLYDEGTVVVMTDPEGTEFCVVGPPGSRVHAH